MRLAQDGLAAPVARQFSGPTGDRSLPGNVTGRGAPVQPRFGNTMNGPVTLPQVGGGAFSARHPDCVSETLVPRMRCPSPVGDSRATRRARTGSRQQGNASSSRGLGDSAPRGGGRCGRMKGPRHLMSDGAGFGGHRGAASRGTRSTPAPHSLPRAIVGLGSSPDLTHLGRSVTPGAMTKLSDPRHRWGDGGRRMVPWLSRAPRTRLQRPSQPQAPPRSTNRRIPLARVT